MGILDDIKTAKEAIAEVASIQAKQDLLRLVNEALELQAANRELQAEIADLREQLAFKGRVLFRDNACWEVDDPIPYCSSCWEASRKAVHLVQWGNDGGFRRCPNCKVEVDIQSLMTRRQR